MPRQSSGPFVVKCRQFYIKPWKYVFTEHTHTLGFPHASHALSPHKLKDK